MALLRLNSLSISFGGNPLLHDINLAVQSAERVALVGRNGTGKSTLLKIIGGLVKPDAGELITTQGLKIAYLRQDVPLDTTGSVYRVVAEGMPDVGRWLADYRAVSEQLATGQSDTDALARIQEKIDAIDGWQIEQKVSETLSRMSLDPTLDFTQLSGGLKRRVLLARALLNEPDILLLDEPTNHLDIASIEWLEEYLASLRTTLIFVTHDRSFLRRLATRIVELDRGQLTDWPGNYDAYLKGKAELLDAESRQNALFDKKLAQEEVWIRQGIKARRTRNEGRVRALKKLREERRSRIDTPGKVNLQINATAKSGKLVLEADQLRYTIADQLLIRDFSTTILRGDKIGVIGPNGIGKSTLIKLLLGELSPDQGTVKLGTRLDVAYYDQLRTALDPQRSAMDNVSGGKDMIEISGETRHIISYMQDFLFPPDRARAPITALSGGETNRLMLAKLFLQPSNFLVLDEPTNDLDVETLELLESLIADYAGTVITISHDREFLDNTVTSIIAFEGQGRVYEYVGGYSDWLRQTRSRDTDPNPKRKKSVTEKDASGQRGNPAAKSPRVKPPKLGYKEQRELDQLPATIEKLEQELAALEEQMSQPDFYTAGRDTQKVIDTAASVSEQLEQAYERWAELEEKTTGTGG